MKSKYQIVTRNAAASVVVDDIFAYAKEHGYECTGV
jgi:hypothetical protein